VSRAVTVRERGLYEELISEAFERDLWAHLVLKHLDEHTDEPRASARSASA
jgi:hypothetical protein